MWRKCTVCLVLFVVVLVATAGLTTSTSRAQASTTPTLGPWGAGTITIGSTLGDLVGLEVVPGTTIDGQDDGYAIKSGDEVIAIVATAGGDDAPIDLIVAMGAVFRTARGIGPGSLVADAEAAYGTAILSFTDADGPELLSLSSSPLAMSFFTSDDGGPEAGIYVDDRTASIDYKPDAVISSVQIDCRTISCPQSPPDEQRNEPAEPSPAPDAETQADAPASEPAAEPEGTLAATGMSEIGSAVGLSLLASGFVALGVRNMHRLVRQDARRR